MLHTELQFVSASVSQSCLSLQQQHSQHLLAFVPAATILSSWSLSWDVQGRCYCVTIAVVNPLACRRGPGCLRCTSARPMSAAAPFLLTGKSEEVSQQSATGKQGGTVASVHLLLPFAQHM